MKLIFLDFDGVLNSHLYFTSGRADVTGVRNNIDSLAVGFLNDLVRKTEASVVVTSSWRLDRTVEELQRVLDEAGFVGEVVGKTIDMRVGEDSDCILRGNEILQWIKSHPAEVGCSYDKYKNYVILDDDSDLLYWQRENFVPVDRYVGMTPNTVFYAGRILNR